MFTNNLAIIKSTFFIKTWPDHLEMIWIFWFYPKFPSFSSWKTKTSPRNVGPESSHHQLRAPFSLGRSPSGRGELTRNAGEDHLRQGWPIGQVLNLQKPVQKWWFSWHSIGISWDFMGLTTWDFMGFLMGFRWGLESWNLGMMGVVTVIYL